MCLRLFFFYLPLDVRCYRLFSLDRLFCTCMMLSCVDPFALKISIHKLSCFEYNVNVVQLITDELNIDEKTTGVE